MAAGSAWPCTKRWAQSMQKSLCPHGTRAATISPSQHKMHSLFSDPRVLLLLLDPTGDTTGDAVPDAEADAEESRKTPESPSLRIWNAADKELSVEPMAVRGSELILRAGGCDPAPSDSAGAANPKLLERFVLPRPKSVDQMLG